MLIELSQPTPDAARIADLAAELRLSAGAAADPATTALLERLSEAARIRVERLTGRALVRRRVELRVSSWREPVVVAIGPVITLDAVESVDAAGLRVPMSSTEWRVDQADWPSIAYVGSWPPPEPPVGGHGAATLTIGHGPAWSEVPADLRQAVTLMAAQGFEDGASGRISAGSLPGAVAALVEPYRRMRL
jgi:uncharacterized phiE125 gp8 family phage protein